MLAYEEAFERSIGYSELRTKLNDLVTKIFVTVTTMTKEMIISDLELWLGTADEIKGEIQYRKDILKAKSYQSHHQSLPLLERRSLMSQN